MCVIVTAEKGSMPTIDQLTRMSETNPDGAGIAWHDGNGLHRVRHSDNGKTLAFITEHWNELKATPCLIHFRLATHGAVNTENTHPFRYTLGNDEHRGAEERDTHPPPPTAGTEKHERTTAGEPPAPPHPHVRHARNPAGLRPPQAGTEDGEGRNVRRSPACNRRRDTARRTFRPSPSGEQAND